jgi:two-component system, chemotaxis family, chemotaxis protein CheY
MKRCLIVDDSSTIRKAIAMILKNFPLEVLEAENGRVALDVCIDQLPEVILLDWNMPVMTGMEFLEALRKLENGSYPKVLMCSTNSEFEHIQEAINKGANEYIMKPFTKEMIEEKLNMVGFFQ